MEFNVYQPITKFEDEHYLTKHNDNAGFIGYLYGDFDRCPGGFYTEWHDCHRGLKNSTFISEFDDLVNNLRGDMRFPLLNSFFGMQGACFAAQKYDGRFFIRQIRSTRKYVFKVVTNGFTYYITCYVRKPLTTQFYIYCYNSRLLDSDMKRLTLMRSCTKETV